MIPKWAASGTLPPIRDGKPGNDYDRSPYKVEFCQIIDRFASSSDRINIMHGLLNYRKALSLAGITSGFQWLDGSFMEQIEVLESRPPNDIDVVTFFHLPDNMTQEGLAKAHLDFFVNETIKEKYKVDAYSCVLGEPTAEHHVKQISYWYSMWSHKRNRLWKGFIQMDLSKEQDIEAENLLNIIRQEGVDA